MNSLLEFGVLSLNSIVQRGSPLTLAGLRYLPCNCHISEGLLGACVASNFGIQIRGSEVALFGCWACRLVLIGSAHFGVCIRDLCKYVLKTLDASRPSVSMFIKKKTNAQELLENVAAVPARCFAI